MKAKLLDKSVTFKENVTAISGNLKLVKNETGLDFAKHKFTVLPACLFEEEMKLNFKVILKKNHRRHLHVDTHSLICT